MAMDKILGSPLLRQSGLDNFRKTREADSQALDEEKGRSSGPTIQDQGGRISGDQAIISPAGKQLMELRQAVDTGRAALAALSDVRPDKVSAVRNRLEQGFYHSSAVRDKVAARLTRVFEGMNQTFS